MTSNKVRRRLLSAMAGAGLLCALSVGPAGALVNQTLTSATSLNESVGIQQCVPVAVPTATATVNATLTASAAGVSNTTHSSTTVSTPNLGTITVCVSADAGAQVALKVAAAAGTGLSGTTVDVAANVVSKTAANAKVTVNGVRVL
jgi:hypothetical protein